MDAKDSISTELEAGKRAIETKTAVLDEMKAEVAALKNAVQTVKDEKETSRMDQEGKADELSAELREKIAETEAWARSNEAFEQQVSELMLTV